MKEAGPTWPGLFYARPSRSGNTGEQREAVVLHLKGGMRFGEIARMQGVSLSTTHGRYRYGMDKLRSLMNGEGKV
ncbi:MAG: hypothetical protein ACYS7Y_33040 [Planctomycetota bacterium]|jgi:DNA-directed RNA polymerase specialized sigma24 family protein